MINFNDIYADNFDKVVSWVSYKISNRADAEEIAQDVFMKVYDHLDNYDAEKSAVSTWVMSIANNKVIDYYRSTNKERQLTTTSIDAMVNEDGDNYFQVSNGSSAVTEIIKEETTKAWQSLVLDLPKTYRRMANLRYNCNMSYDEIAERMGVSLGTVKGKLSRATAIMKDRV